MTGATLKNSFKLAGPAREYIFACPDPATKGWSMERKNSEFESKHLQVFGWRHFAIGQGLNRQPRPKED